MKKFRICHFSLILFIQGEDFITYNPRDRRISPRDSYVASNSTSSDSNHPHYGQDVGRKFDLSCHHFDHNIKKIKLLTLLDVSGDNQECLKGIEVQFSDGTEAKTTTEAGESNR